MDWETVPIGGFEPQPHATPIMFDTVFAVALALPIGGILIAFAALLPSWRWVFGLIIMTGTVLLWARMHYGLFASPVWARAVFGLLLHSFILVAISYCGGLLWYLSRRVVIGAPSGEPHRIDWRQVRVD
jgi:hypothetical protein